MMFRHAVRVLLCLLVVGFGAALPVRAESQQVFAHVFAVPVNPPTVADVGQVTAAFEDWLATSFGGYTRLGAGEGGWKNENGQLEHQDNTLYLVSTDRDASKEIAGRIARDFGERQPYVLVFPAGLFVK